MTKRERMSSVDTAWLRMDTPTNLMMIVGVLMFSTPLDFARLKRTLELRLLHYRRFRQRVVHDVAGAWWELDPNFDIDSHVLRVSLPGKAGKSELETYVAGQISQSLDQGLVPIYYCSLNLKPQKWLDFGLGLFQKRLTHPNCHNIQHPN